MIHKQEWNTGRKGKGGSQIPCVGGGLYSQLKIKENTKPRTRPRVATGARGNIDWASLWKGRFGDGK